jgi:hypothetical protein
MISQALIDVLTAIGRLTYAEQSQLIQLIAGEQPSTVETAAKPEVKDQPQKRHPNANRKWSDEETLALLDYMEDAEIMSPKERMRKKRLLAKSIGRSVKAVENRASEIKCGRAK